MYDFNDASHRKVRAFLAANREPIVFPSPTMAEVGHLLLAHDGVAAEARLLRAVARGALNLVDPIRDDYARAADLVEQYADFPLGTVDALIVAMADRLDVRPLFTLDHRHFGAVKPLHRQSFTLVP